MKKSSIVLMTPSLKKLREHIALDFLSIHPSVHPFMCLFKKIRVLKFHK